MAEKLNLSARLDRARAQREAGLAPDPGRTEWDLRFQDEEGQAYDGHGIRTGEQLSAEQWSARAEVADLPTWRRLRFDARSETAIDLTDPTPAPEASDTVPICPSCGHDADIDTVDLASDSVRYGCPSCGRVWQASRAQPPSA